MAQHETESNLSTATLENQAVSAPTGTGWRPRMPLPDGPLDILGDIHGELDALRAIMSHLGYAENGDHPAGRRMVFVGDLVDRGPDSPGVIRLVSNLVDRGVAQAVMGNHDLNAISQNQKKENTWFFGHGPVHSFERTPSSAEEREQIIQFIGRLPLALERAGLRVVHAAWDDEALNALESAGDLLTALTEHRARVEQELGDESDPVERSLAHQNRNPVKLLTSGPEVRTAQAIHAGGKMCFQARHAWWDAYDDEPLVVFGHYSRLWDKRFHKGDQLFDGYPLNSTLGRGFSGGRSRGRGRGRGRAICVDYSVGGRIVDRKAGNLNGPFVGRLGALRWPERELVFDDGERMPVIEPEVVS
ncbi:MAG: metallophosphoesterase [Phycisphaeraceae bacterium]